MNINRLMRAAALGLLAASAASLTAAEKNVEYSFDPDGADLKAWGTGKKESYDVAVRLADPGLAGAKVLGFTCPLTCTTGFDKVSGWLSTELTVKSNANVPDVTSTTATVDQNGNLSVTFPEPYTLTADGVYVGFSLSVTTLDDGTKEPFILADVENPDGLYVHATRSYRKWVSFGQSTGTLPMVINLSGEFADNCVAVSTVPSSYASAGKSATVMVELSNYGTSAVSSVDYTWKAGDAASGSGSASLSTPIPASIGAKGAVPMEISPISALGNYPLEVTVTKVNGQTNESTNATGAGSLKVLAFVPVTRPLMEEYTGLWCGWCPRGYIALERMKHEFGDRFVAISYHDSDSLQCVMETPTIVDGFPCAIVNRSYDVDPWYGLGNRDMGIRNLWSDLASELAPADIYAELDWADDAHTTLKCTSEVRFVNDETDADYRISYALVADGIREIDGHLMDQHSYYAGETGMVGDDWKPFTESANVYGLTFNDILVAYNDQQGLPGSVPSDIKSNVPYTDSYTYALQTNDKGQTGLLNIKGSGQADYGNVPVVSDYSKLRCIAILTKADGTFVNCCSSLYLGEKSGITPATVGDTKAPVVAVEYYDLTGRRVDPSGHGIFIRAERRADGSMKAVKIRQ